MPARPAADGARPDGGARRGRPRSEAARAAILDAAIALIREVGYDALAFEAIAARAGVGKATLYRWWPSRELLVAEAVGRIVRAIPIPDGGTVEHDVLALMRRLARMYQDPATRVLLPALVAAMGRSAHVAESVRAAMVAPWRDAMRAVLERAIARGELRAETDVELALDLLSGPLFYRYLMLGQSVDESRTRALVHVVLRAMAPDAAERR